MLGRYVKYIPMINSEEAVKSTDIECWPENYFSEKELSCYSELLSRTDYLRDQDRHGRQAGPPRMFGPASFCDGLRH